MAVPVGLNVWSRLVEELFPYLDQVVGPFDSLWFPEGWSLLAFALARYPDKLCGHDVLCNSFRNPAHLAKMAATAQTISGGRVVLGLGAGWHSEEYQQALKLREPVSTADLVIVEGYEGPQPE